MYEDGRLAVRPAKPVHRIAPGVHQLTLRSGARGWLLIPALADDGPRSFALLLHGAGEQADHGLELLRPEVDRAGVVVLAPQSEGRTWDVIRGGYGRDVEAIDDLLAVAFARFTVDPARLAVGGFSDGASYALALGMTNGGLFTHVLAFSPGFAAPGSQPDSPKLFVSHGTADPVLPVARCSRQLAPALQRAGYDVRYREFDGGHVIPKAVRAEAMEWFLASPAVERRTATTTREAV